MGTLACPTEPGSGSLGTAQEARPVQSSSRAKLSWTGRAVAPASYRAFECPSARLSLVAALSNCDGCSFAFDAVTERPLRWRRRQRPHQSCRSRPGLFDYEARDRRLCHDLAHAPTRVVQRLLVEVAERLEAETLRTIPSEAERIEKHQFRVIFT
jgi:hypothetical protein